MGTGGMTNQGQLMLTMTDLPLVICLVYKQELMSQSLQHKLAVAMEHQPRPWTVGPKA